MRLHLDDCEVMQPSGQNVSPPSLARAKNSVGSIVVDMGSRGAVDLRLKIDTMDLHSPNKKEMRPEPLSRIHCIPLLLVFVFFILWAGSSEIVHEAESSADALPEMYIMRVPISTSLPVSKNPDVITEETAVGGTGGTQLPNHLLGSNEKPYQRITTR